MQICCHFWTLIPLLEIEHLSKDSRWTERCLQVMIMSCYLLTHIVNIMSWWHPTIHPSNGALCSPIHQRGNRRPYSHGNRRVSRHTELVATNRRPLLNSFVTSGNFFKTKMMKTKRVMSDPMPTRPINDWTPVQRCTSQMDSPFNLTPLGVGPRIVSPSKSPQFPRPPEHVAHRTARTNVRRRPESNQH